MALAAAPFSPAVSALSALTVQPVRGSRRPASSSRLNSAIDAQGLPATSLSASRRTKRTLPGSVMAQLKSQLIAPLALMAFTLTKKLPVRVGVPRTRPVAVSRLRPSGRPVAL